MSLAVAFLALMMAAAPVLASCGQQATSSTADTSAVTGSDGWQTLPPSPLAARVGATAIWTGKEVVVFGGYDPAANETGDGSATTGGTTLAATTVIKSTSTFAMPEVPLTRPPPKRQPGTLLDGAAYNPATRAWRALPAAPIPDGYSPRSITSDGDRLTLLFGRGSVCVANDQSPEPAGAWYDAAADAWQSIPASPQPFVCGERGAWLAGKLWVYGAIGGAVYDPIGRTWVSAPLVTDEQASVLDLHPVGDRLVAQVSRRRGDEVAEASLRSFDPATQQWTDLPASPVLSFSIVVAGERLYAWDAGTNDAASLDVASGQWTRLPAAPIATRYGNALATVEDRLVVWGGNATPKRTGPRPDGQIITPGPPLRDGAVYDPVTSAWSIIADAPIDGRQQMAATSAAGRLFVWGGGREEKTSNGSRTVPESDGAELTPQDGGSGTPSTTATPTTAPRPTFEPPRSAIG